jgi:hypothetical protein
VAEIRADVRGGCGAHGAEAVGARCGDGGTEAGEQRVRDGMRGHAHADGVLPAGHRVRHPCPAPQDQREWAGPERIREQPCRRGHLACGSERGVGIREVQDERVIRGAPLHREDAAHGCVVARVGAEAVHRLRGEGDEPTRAKSRDGLVDRGAQGRVERHIHGEQIG